MSALVSEQLYRKLTGDLRTPVDEVTTALAVAQGLVEMRLGRALGLGEYTEFMNVYPNLLVYPAVTPLADQTGRIDSATLQLDGYPSDLATWDWEGGSASYTAYGRPRAEVTYTGGYDDTTVPQPLAMGIALVAKHLLSPASDVSMAGIKSYSEGDISATYDTPLDSSWPAGVWQLIKRWAKREVSAA